VHLKRLLIKTLGLCCGRKMGNSEILIKEALVGVVALTVTERF